MKSSNALRFARILFFSFLMLHIFLITVSLFLWKGASIRPESDGNMQFAVAVFISLFAIIAYVLFYAQSMLKARDCDTPEKKLEYYRSGQLWRNIICLLPSLLTLAGIFLTQQMSFFFIAAVNLLIHLAYIPAEQRMRRDAGL